MRRNSFRLGAAAAAAAVGLVLSLNASAAPVTSFVSTPVATDTTYGNGANAIVDDPNLAGRILNLMMVNVGGNDWTNSALRIQLTSGTVYNATNAVATEGSPNAAFWTVAGFRNGPYDSFVNSKGLGANPDTNPQSTFIAGTYNADRTPGPPPPLGLTTNGATLVSVQWGNTVAGETGSFSVGRITLSPDATGTFIGESFDSASGGVGTQFSGTIAGGIMVIPEPAGLGLLGIAAVAGASRRRRLSA